MSDDFDEATADAPMTIEALEAEIAKGSKGMPFVDFDIWLDNIAKSLVTYGLATQTAMMHKIKAQTGTHLSVVKAALKDHVARKKRAAAGAAFVRGDHVERAERALELLRRESPEPLVFAEGNLYRFNVDTGLWAVIEMDEQCRVVTGFANSHQLLTEAKDMNGAVKVSHQLAGRSRFFVEAVAGIAFKNGIVVWNGQAMTFAKLGPEHRARVTLPYSYRPGGRARRFHKFLRQCFRGDKDIEGKIRLLQEFAGACLLGQAASFAKVMVLLGRGANGKSVFLRVLGALFPRAAQTSIPPHKLTNDYYVARLAGALINLVGELPESEILESETFKAIVAGDEVEARSPYKEPFRFAPIAGHVFAANRLPATSDVTHAFWRRFLVLEWPRIFKDEEQDKRLAEKLIATEMPAISAWVVRGAAHVLARDRYLVPKSVAAAVEVWRNGADAVALFVADWTVPASTDSVAIQFQKNMSVLRPWTTASGLYDLFKIWADKNGHKRLSSKTFGDRLTAMDIPKFKRTDATYYALASKEDAICRTCQTVSRPGIEHECGSP